MPGAEQALKDVGGIVPALVLWGGALVLLLMAPVTRRGQLASIPGNAAVVVVLMALAMLIRSPEQGYGREMFAAALQSDTLSASATFVLLLAGFLAVLVGQGYLKARSLDRAEYYALLLLSLSGAYVMILANDLLFVLLGLELMSFGFYILAGFDKRSSRCGEAALKYFLTGAFASALFIYGLMLFYGCAGSTALEAIRSAIAHGALKTPMGAAAAMLVLAGLAFKVAAVPFHQWAPDVYDGAPTSATAFLATTAKIGAFAAFVRVAESLAGGWSTWVPILRIVAIVTMVLGNLIALSQTNVKRMLGYSAVAHAGYLLAAVLCVGMSQAGQEGARSSMPAMNAVIFYLLAYALAVVGAFGVLAYLSSANHDVSRLDDIRGLVRRVPAAGYALVILMLSLAGIPGTAGFIAKWQVFYAVLTTGDTGMAVAIALTSALAAYYYLRVVWYAVFEEPARDGIPDTKFSTAGGAAVYLTTGATLLLGVLPGFLMEFLRVVR